jgi:hypothetical protein
VDRDAIARARRKREVEEELTDERGREEALREQIELIVGEAEGLRIDGALRALLDPDDVELLDDFLLTDAPHDTDEPDEAWDEEEDDDVGVDAEVARLLDEIARSQARQQALERAARLLDDPLAVPADAGEG